MALVVGACKYAVPHDLPDTTGQLARNRARGREMVFKLLEGVTAFFASQLMYTIYKSN